MTLLNMFKTSDEYFTDLSKEVRLLWIIFVMHTSLFFCLYYTILSGLCCLMITCWERVDLMTPLCVMFIYVFITFPYGVSGQMRYLFVSIPELCLLFFTFKDLSIDERL